MPRKKKAAGKKKPAVPLPTEKVIVRHWNRPQSEFMRAKERYVDFEGAIRSGKTTPLIWKMLNYAVEYPGIKEKVARMAYHRRFHAVWIGVDAVRNQCILKHLEVADGGLTRNLRTRSELGQVKKATRTVRGCSKKTRESLDIAAQRLGLNFLAKVRRCVGAQGLFPNRTVLLGIDAGQASSGERRRKVKIPADLTSDQGPKAIVVNPSWQ